MKSWLENDIEDLTAMVEVYCDNVRWCSSECPFYSSNNDCLGDITTRLNTTLNLIKKYKRELSQYV